MTTPTMTIEEAMERVRDIPRRLQTAPSRGAEADHKAIRLILDEVERLKGALAEAQKERSHQQGRADRNAKDTALWQRKAEDLKDDLERQLDGNQSDLLRITEIAGERDAAEAHAKRLEDALHYYADESIYGVNGDLDYGARARAALAEETT